MNRKIIKALFCVVLTVSLLLSSVCVAFAAQESSVNLGVISDIHYFPNEYIGSLNGYNYRRSVDNDLKLEQYAAQIVDAAIDELIAKGVGVVLIPGDNAMRSEYLSHEQLTAKLSRLTEAGIAVYTVPGNHDITDERGDRRPLRYVCEDAQATVTYAGVTYTADEAESVKGTTVEDFKRLYADFGYGENENILARNGLSYVARLAEGYRLIAVDCNIYNGEYYTGEKEMSDGLKDWVFEQIKACTAAGEAPLVMTHYDFVEKYGMQSSIMGGNFLDGGEKIAAEMADSGVEYIFTGHSHANDISALTTRKGSTVYEICTGSLLMHGSPVRSVEFSGADAKIRTTFLPSIEGVEDFQGFCEDYYYTDGIRTIMRNRLIFDVSEIVADFLSSSEGGYNRVYNWFFPLMMTVTDGLLNSELAGGVTVCDLLTEMYKQHYHGNEEYSPQMKAAVAQILNGNAFIDALDLVFTSINDSIGINKLWLLEGTVIDSAIDTLLLFAPSKLLGIVFGDFAGGILTDGYPCDNDVDIVGGAAFEPDGTPCKAEAFTR